MSTPSTLKSERLRATDGTLGPLIGGDIFADTSARSRVNIAAAAGVGAVTGAARAAVMTSPVVPYSEARILFEDIRDYAVSSFYVTTALVDGGSLSLTPGAATIGPWSQGDVAWGRANANVAPLMLDAGYSVDDELYALSADVSEALVAAWGTRPAAPMRRLVGSAGAVAGDDAWVASFGSVAQAAVTPGTVAGFTRSQVWTHTGVASSFVASPWRPSSYTLGEGRTFTVSAWLLGGVALQRVRFALRFRAGGVTVATVTGRAIDVPAGAWARRVDTLTIPAGFPDELWREVRLQVELVSAPSASTVSVHAPHAYAGSVDRGDSAGLRARVVPAGGLKLTHQYLDTTTHRYTRMDVHGSDAVGHVTSATLLGAAGEVLASAASSGRLTLRTAEPQTLRNSDTFAIVAEETGTGGNDPSDQGVGDVFVQLIEPIFEVDTTPSLVEMTVRRSLEGDPGDSTTPIGNYSAGSCTVELENAAGDWSPFRVDYINLGHRIETAVGVAYTNRHNDPHGDGLDEAAWRIYANPGTAGDVTVDDTGFTPQPHGIRGATSGASGYAQVGASVDVIPGQVWRVRSWHLISGDSDPESVNTATGVRFYDETGANVLMTADVDKPTALWSQRDRTVTVPDGAVLAVAYTYVQSATHDASSTAYAEVSAPSFELMDAATGGVWEVLEVAPAGVFYSTTWPTDSSSETVTVDSVDALAQLGGAIVNIPATQNMSAATAIRWVARESLDLGIDQFDVSTTATLPWFVPAATAAETLVDLAMAAGLTAYIDGGVRFVAHPLDETAADPAVAYTGETNLVRAGAPINPDSIINDVRVTGHPLSYEAGTRTVATVGNDGPPDITQPWYPTDRDIPISAGGYVTLTLDHDVAAIVGDPTAMVYAYRVSAAGTINPVNVSTSGPGPIVDVQVVVRSHPTFTELILVNYGVYPVSVPFAKLDAPAVLISGTLSSRITRDTSIRRYGARSTDVDVRLAQGTGDLSTIGERILDTWSLISSDGGLWVPDLEGEVLGDPWRDLADRVIASETRTGVVGEFYVVSHELTVGTSMASSLYLRRAPAALPLLIVDVGLLDDGNAVAF